MRCGKPMSPFPYMAPNDTKEIPRQRSGLADQKDRIRLTCACGIAMFFRLTAFAAPLGRAAAALLKCRPSGPHAAAAAQTDETGSRTIPRLKIARLGRFRGARKSGGRVVSTEGGLAMQLHSPTVLSTPRHAAEMDRLGDEIAELSAHLDAATARLLELIREFDARGGWNTGFRTCAARLSWRGGLELGAAPGTGP